VTDLLLKKDGTLRRLKASRGSFSVIFIEGKPSFITRFTSDALGSPWLCGEKAIYFSKSQSIFQEPASRQAGAQGG